MTKKDYILIAKVLKEYQGYLVVQDIAKKLAHDLEETNPIFNRHKFLKACGVDPHDEAAL